MKSALLLLVVLLGCQDGTTLLKEEPAPLPAKTPAVLDVFVPDGKVAIVHTDTGRVEWADTPWRDTRPACDEGSCSDQLRQSCTAMVSGPGIPTFFVAACAAGTVQIRNDQCSCKCAGMANTMVVTNCTTRWLVSGS